MNVNFFSFEVYENFLSFFFSFFFCRPSSYPRHCLLALRWTYAGAYAGAAGLGVCQFHQVALGVWGAGSSRFRLGSFLLPWQCLFIFALFASVAILFSRDGHLSMINPISYSSIQVLVKHVQQLYDFMYTVDFFASLLLSSGLHSSLIMSDS